VNFIDRKALMKLLDKYGELGLHSAQALSREFQSAYRDIHELVSARSSAGKLARRLLSWSGAHERDSACREIRIRSSMTHEQIAQMIGLSRGDGHPPAKRTQKEGADSPGRVDFGHPQSTCVGGAGCVELLGSSKRAVVDANRLPSPFPFSMGDATACARLKIRQSELKISD
jgi:hypothetical protein